MDENHIIKEDIESKKTQIDRVKVQIDKITETFNKQNERIKSTQDCVKEAADLCLFLAEFASTINELWKENMRVSGKPHNADKEVKRLKTEIKSFANIVSERAKNLPSSKLGDCFQNGYKKALKLAVTTITSLSFDNASIILKEGDTVESQADDFTDPDFNPIKEPISPTTSSLKSLYNKFQSEIADSSEDHDFTSGFTSMILSAHSIISKEVENCPEKEQLVALADKLENDLQIYEKQRESMKSSLQELNNKVEDLELQKSKIENDLDNENYQDRIEHSMQEISKLESQISELKDQKDTQESMLKERLAQIAEKKDQILQIQESIEEETKILGNNEETLLHQSSQLESLNIAKEELSVNITQSNTAIDLLNDQIQALEKELKSAELEHRNSTKTAEELETNLTDLNEKVKCVKLEIEIAESAIANRGFEVLQIQDKIVKLQSELEEKKSKVIEIQSELSDQESKLLEIEPKVVEVEKEYKIATEKSMALKQAIASKIKLLEDTKSSINEVNIDSLKAAKEKKSIEVELKTLEARKLEEKQKKNDDGGAYCCTFLF